MFLPRPVRFRNAARAYARAGVPIAPAESVDVAGTVTTDVARIEAWWPRSGPVSDIAAVAGERLEVVETGAVLTAHVVDALLDLVCAAHTRLGDG